MANVSISGTTATASYQGATIDSEGNIDLSGLVSKATDALLAKSPQAVKDIADGLVSASAAYASTVEGASQAAAFFAADASTTAAVTSAATVVGVVVAVAALLLTIDPAKGGPGCCGTDKSKPKGTCAPSEFDWYGPNGPGSIGNEGGQWAGDHWTVPGSQRKWTPANAWETAIGGFIMGKFNALSSCFTYLSPQWYVATLTAAIAAWNMQHSASKTAKVSRVVNWVMPGGTFGGVAQPALIHQPQSYFDPIALALNAAVTTYTKDAHGNVIVTGSKVRPFATASFTVNTGPAIPSGLGTLGKLGIGKLGIKSSPKPAPHVSPVATQQHASNVALANIAGVPPPPPPAAPPAETTVLQDIEAALLAFAEKVAQLVRGA